MDILTFFKRMQRLEILSYLLFNKKIHTCQSIYMTVTGSDTKHTENNEHTNKKIVMKILLVKKTRRRVNVK